MSSSIPLMFLFKFKHFTWQSHVFPLDLYLHRQDERLQQLAAAKVRPTASHQLANMQLPHFPEILLLLAAPCRDFYRYFLGVSILENALTLLGGITGQRHLGRGG
jgi:hypothetical protein